MEVRECLKTEGNMGAVCALNGKEYVYQNDRRIALCLFLRNWICGRRVPMLQGILMHYLVLSA